MASAAVGVLQCLLKLFNFILALLGVLMVVYSLYMLNEWNKQQGGGGDAPAPPPTPSPSLREGMLQAQFAEMGVMASAMAAPFLLAGGLSIELPAPWFIYAFLAVGVFICLVTLSGAIAAEVHSACCLSCYQFGIAFMLLIQVVLAAILFLDRSWAEDLPEDPTGELDSLTKFIKENFDIVKWAALAVLIVQLVAVGLAMILRAMHASGPQHEEDVEDPYAGTVREPLVPAEGGVQYAVVTDDEERKVTEGAKEQKKGKCSIL